MAAPVTQYRIINKFSPLAWQKEAWRSIDKILVMAGGAGGGKSALAANKMHGLLLKYPNSTGLVVRKTRESLKNSVIPLFEFGVIGNDPRVRYVPSENRFEYSNGSILVFGGMKNEEQREAIRSIGRTGSVEFVWVEEATGITERDFNELLARLRGTASPFRQIILTTNPGPATHWINKRLIIGKEGNSGAVKYIPSFAAQNIYNPADYLDTLNRLSGIDGLRLREGKWTVAEGLVFDGYDSTIHNIKPFKIPDSWEKIMTVDFGFKNPFVADLWALDEDKRAYHFGEIYYSERTVPQHAAAIKEMLAERGLTPANVSKWICDWDAGDRALLESEFEEYGVKTVAARKGITKNIQLAKKRLDVQKDGRPRVYFFDDNVLYEEDDKLRKASMPASMSDEIIEYTWLESSGTNKGNRNISEKPIEKNDHAMNSFCYMAGYLDRGDADIVDLSKIYTEE